MKWLLLAFLGVAAANQVNDWSPSQEYRYHYTTSAISGLPQLGRQHAGLKLSAVIKAQRFPDQTIRIQLEEPKFQNFNDEIEWREMSPYSLKGVEERDELPSEVKRHLEAPFKVTTNEGLLEKIHVESSEPEYITNMKRAAVSHLLALSKSPLTHERRFQPSVKRMETSIVGECETLYTISRLPEYLAREFEQREQIPKQELCEGKEYYEVIKTKNLKVCKQRPIYMQVYGANSVSDGSMGSVAPFADEASVTKAVICGSPESFHIRKVTNEHKYLVSPSGKFENEEKLQVTAATRLSFHSEQPRSREIPDVSSPKPRGSLMFEYPVEDSITATSSMKASIRSSRPEEEEDQWYLPQMPKPDLVSAPVSSLFPKVKPAEESKGQVIRAFLRIVDNAQKSPESSHSHEDVAGTAVMISRVLVQFGLEEIKSLWSKIESRVPVDAKEIAHHAFLDLVSTAGTNPSVKYVVDMVKSQRLPAGEAAAWIVSNAIRSVKTPTVELLKELIAVLKHEAVQGDRNMASTVALSLTHLIHRACIDETSSVYDFPVKSYGRFCDEKSPVITRELIPFLAEKLTSAQPNEINKMITYINALGNLGHDGAALHLLRAIEGVPSRDPHPRSVAVYQLHQAARVNPALYRPVILALIANEAEIEEVRMAAITVLPYTRPESAQLNGLAVRTWFEPSKQVASYIATTLKTLAKLPTHSPLYTMLAEKAQQAYRLCKPVNTGIEMSHNVMISQFLDTLRASVNVKLQHVTTEESIVPKNLFIKDSVISKSHHTQIFEAAANVQGAEYLINKLYEVYATFQPDHEQQRMEAQENYIKNIIHVESRRLRKPEAHITVKAMGIQRIFSLDNQMVERIIEEVTRDTMEVLRRHNTISKDILKVIDLNGNHAIIPTECGLPVYIAHQTPLVISGKAHLRAKLSDMKNGQAALAIEPVVNYKQITQAGIFCPITKKFLVAGVDTHVHVALPLKAEVMIRDGQYTVYVGTPMDEESQKEKPVFELRVKPYSASYDLSAPTLLSIPKCYDAKIIRSGHQELQRKEYPLGRPLGLDLRLKVETEQPTFDIAEVIQSLYQHRPLTLLTLPLPLKTVKDHSVSVIFNPRDSNTKFASLSFSFGYGEKKNQGGEPEVTHYSSVRVPAEVERKCREESERYSSEEREEMRDQCEREKIAEEEKRECMRELSRQSRPAGEIERDCTKRSYVYTCKHTSYKSIKNTVKKILRDHQNSARAVSLHVQAALHAQNRVAERKVQAQIAISEDDSLGQKKLNKMRVEVDVKTPHSQLPYKVDVEADRMIERPVSQWDKDAILRENIGSKINVRAQFGRRQEKQEIVQLDIQAERSPEQKSFARNSESWKKCDRDLAKNQQLSDSCKWARRYAASLDEIKGELALPKVVAKSPITATVVGIVQAYFIPYLRIEESSFDRQSSEQDYVKIFSKIAPSGKVVTIELEANRQKIVLKNVRIVPALEEFVPFCVLKSLPMQVVKKLSQYGLPQTCVVEGDKVQTFDNLTYSYPLNDCEHVLVKDISERPRILVTAKKTPALHIVKVVIDGNKYELELVKASRGSRSQAGKVKVNDQIKQGERKGQLEIFEDKYNQIFKWADGVFEIHSNKYGLKIRADSMSTQVSSFPQKLRNLVTGLCGDMNGEKTADVKSAKQCIMSSPKLAAYSFMVEDRKCAGIPSAEKEKFQREEERCVRKDVLPSKVYDIFTLQHHAGKRRQTSLQHVTQQQGQQICISKRQVKVCGIEGQPKEIVPREMPFFCVSLDREGSTLQKMAWRGERIESAEKRPTAYTASVYEPRQC